MSKTDNAQKIADLQKKIDDANAKITAINGYIAQLRAFNTDIKYVLISHGNIKSTYELAGKPYAEMADDEEEITKTTGDSFSASRDAMISSLVSMTRGINMNIQSWQSSIRALSD